MYGCERWTVKKAEHRKTDAFELWCWRRLLRVPWTARRSNPVHPKGDQSWVFIGRPDAEVETPILWPPHAKSWLTGKDPDAGRYPGQEEKGTTQHEMAGWSPTRWTWVWVNTGSWWWTRRPGLLWFMGSQRVRHDWATELNWKSQVVLVIKNPPTNSGDLRDEGLIPGSGRSPGGGHGYPLQYACLEDPMDGGAWRAAVPGVAKTQTWLKWLSIHVKEPGGLKEISMIFFHLGFKK